MLQSGLFLVTILALFAASAYLMTRFHRRDSQSLQFEQAHWPLDIEYHQSFLSAVRSEAELDRIRDIFLGVYENNPGQDQYRIQNSSAIFSRVGNRKYVVACLG